MTTIPTTAPEGKSPITIGEDGYLILLSTLMRKYKVMRAAVAHAASLTPSLSQEYKDACAAATKAEQDFAVIERQADDVIARASKEYDEGFNFYMVDGGDPPDGVTAAWMRGYRDAHRDDRVENVPF